LLRRRLDKEDATTVRSRRRVRFSHTPKKEFATNARLLPLEEEEEEVYYRSKHKSKQHRDDRNHYTQFEDEEE